MGNIYLTMVSDERSMIEMNRTVKVEFNDGI
jgi:hypothetical protein